MVKLISVLVRSCREDNVRIFLNDVESAIVLPFWAEHLFEFGVGFFPPSALLKLLRRLIQLIFVRICAVIIIVKPGKNGFADADHSDIVIRVVVSPLGLITVARQASQRAVALIVIRGALRRPEVLWPVALPYPSIVPPMAAPVPILGVPSKPAEPGSLALIVRRRYRILLDGMALASQRT